MRAEESVDWVVRPEQELTVVAAWHVVGPRRTIEMILTPNHGTAMYAECSCGNQIRVQTRAVGLKIVCPACGAIVRIKKPRGDPFANLDQTDDPPVYKRKTLMGLLKTGLMMTFLFLLLGIMVGIVVEIYLRMNAKPATTHTASTETRKD